MNTAIPVMACLLLVGAQATCDKEQAPRSVEPLVADFDPQQVPLDAQRRRDGDRLAFDVQSEQPDELVGVLTEDFFRFHRGGRKEYVSVVKWHDGKEPQTVMREPQEFTPNEGEALSSWEETDVLGFRAYRDAGKELPGSKPWAGLSPELRRMHWIEAEASP